MNLKSTRRCNAILMMRRASPMLKVNPMAESISKPKMLTPRS